jgi:THO complex subunit 2
MQPFYDYSIVTEDRVTRWSKGARQEVVEHGIQSRKDEDLTEVVMIFQELIHSVTDGRLQGSDAGAVVKDILGPELSEADRYAAVFDPHTLFLDTVSTFMDVESGPLRPQLRDFMTATDVSPTLMRIVLDPPILQHLDLIRDTFVRMGIRQSTNLLYRQASYNLLREETEGFAKLVTELFTTSSSEPPTSEVVQAAFNKVMGLIGTFDLHPGRVLDVTLDVFAAVLIKQFRFFVKFLRVSSWWPRSQLSLPPNTFIGGLPNWALPEHSGWTTTEQEEVVLAQQRLERDIAFWERARKVKLDAYFELGGRQLAPSDEERLAKGATDGGAESSIEQEWIKITKTLPPPGNRDAAQMLGFKLRFYTSEARDAQDTLPANLLYLISLLIKVGFISLTDLWNHVWPLDEDMESVKVRRMKELDEKEKADRPGGGKNALLMAGALPDDMPPPPSMASRRDAAATKPDPNSKAPEPAEAKPALPGPDDQKVLLLKCLLTIGAIPEALFIVGRHDWILRAFPDLISLFHRILHHSIDVVYQQSSPASSRPTACPPKKQLDPDQSGALKGHLKLSTPPVRRALRWPNPDQADVGEGPFYRFYWDEWADNVPVCQTVDNLFTLCDTLLNVIGVNIGLDASLVAKLTRIGCKSLADDQSPKNSERWLGLLKRLLVPSLSLGDPNSSAADSVWTLLKQYPIRARFGVYAEWYEGATSRLEPMQKAFARTRLHTLSKMKRLSHSNIIQMAKDLAKIAYPSPGVVCKVALQQIESYDNLIEAFVECAKYFTDLGYDVLVWSVLSSLASQERSRTQATSVLLTSKWLQALSRFSGKVFERYSNMDPLPILRYVHTQLLQGNSTDLLILEELIESMGGIVSGFDFTDAQLRGMTGGDLLRRQTLINLGDKREASARSAKRLMKALSQSNLAGQLLINIAQYRQNAIYNITDGNAVIKFLSALVDGAHKVLSRYLDLLLSNMDPGTFDSSVPDVIQLMRDYGLDANLAFMIRRNNIRWDTKALASARDSSPQTAKIATDVDGDVTMETAAGSGTPAKDGTGDNSPASKTPNSRLPESLPDALAPLIDEIPKVMPQQSWQHISPACYVFFWSLQLGNLVWPQDSYEAENTRLKAQAAELTTDRSDTPRSAASKKRKREDILDRQQRLVQEMKEGIERFQKTKINIGRQTSGWFPAGISNADATSDTLLEECILPRLQISPVDADYCFRLIKFLHENPKSNFKLMSLYDRLFNHNRLRALIFTCTVREAEHLARFLKFILGDLSKWHGSKAAYEKEALGLKELQGTKTREYLGFATAFDEGGKPTEFIEHDAFKELLFRWHKELNTALRSCLNGLEWMHIRNAISILKGVIDFFPAINFMADKFLEQLNTIKDRESASSNASESAQGHRVDLSVTAQTTYSELKRRKDKWVLVQAFRPGAVSISARDPRAFRG